VSMCGYACISYVEAVQPVEDGLAMIERGLVPTDCYWPGTDIVIDSMSSADILKVLCSHLTLFAS